MALVHSKGAAWMTRQRVLSTPSLCRPQLQRAPRVSVHAAATVPLPKGLNLKRSKFGSSDLMVSEVCMGTMTFGEQNTEAEAHEQLDYVAECGVNFLDTAEIYPIAPRRETANRTSKYIGTWLKKQRRDKFVVATKVAGRAPTMAWVVANRHDPPLPEGPTPRLDGKSIIAAAEAELRRLQTDYIDIFQFHWPDRYMPNFGQRQYQLSELASWNQEVNGGPPSSFAEQVEAVGSLIRQGKVRHWGLSNESSFGVVSQCHAADALGVPRPVSIQNNYSLINRSFEGELAEVCAPHNYNLALMPWSALAGGALTGKYLMGYPPRSRFDLFAKRYERFHTQRVHRATLEYVRIAREAGMTPAQLAYGFCRSRWFIPSTMIGATSMAQLQENMEAFALPPLGQDVLAAIQQVHLQHTNPAIVD